MKTILVPTDFSANADNACKYAIEIARDTKARIILMHTFESPLLYSDIPMVEVQMDFATLRESALNKLREYHKKIGKVAQGIKIDFLIEHGLASARINEAALEKRVDLIVMGTTGTGAVERVLIGSNASRVIRNAPCMVLAIPPKAKYDGMKKIVYTTDMSFDNLSHARTIIPFAKIFNAEILFLNVNTSLFNDTRKEKLDKMTVRIKSHVRYPKISGYVCDSPNVANGIHFFIKKHKADCLAMYTHHKGVLDKIFRMSVTKSVAVNTTIPLLAIHECDFVEEPVRTNMKAELIN
jgi:nucleotide-binding universal stress UspA family protein